MHVCVYVCVYVQCEYAMKCRYNNNIFISTLILPSRFPHNIAGTYIVVTRATRV